MKNFLPNSSTIELAGDYLVQELWQGILRDSQKLERYYSLQYFKYELHSDLVGDSDYLHQKIHEYGTRFYHSLDDVYEQFKFLKDTIIPFDVIYDKEQQSIFLYFMIPYQFADIFSSEEEWNFASSEVPANMNVKTKTKVKIDSILD